MNGQRHPLFIVFRTISLALLLVNLKGQAQANPENKRVEFSLSVGFSVQFLAFDRLFLQPQNLRYITYSGDIIYGGLNNESGIGLPVTIKAYDPKLGIGLLYEPIFRYDIVDITNFGKPTSGVFMDHHFSVFHEFALYSPFLSKPFKKPLDFSVGAGYSLISPSQTYGLAWELYDIQTHPKKRKEMSPNFGTFAITTITQSASPLFNNYKNF